MVEVNPADLADALGEGFQPRTAEKVYRLLGVLREIQSLRSTRSRFVLKGGTALNVFHSHNVPRLSVDLDLMATGFPGAAAGTPEHGRVVDLTRGVLTRLEDRVTTSDSPAACTLVAHYRDRLGGQDQLKVDLDILNRQTLLPPQASRGPSLFLADDLRFPVVRRAELFGQKLVAVAYRAHPRDLYDMHSMIGSGWHRESRARKMYLAYSFLQDSEWARLDYPVRLVVDYRPALLADVLRTDELPPTLQTIRSEARAALSGGRAPFTRASARERSLRSDLLHGDRDAFAKIVGEKVVSRCRRLARHPGLLWRLQQAAAQGGRGRPSI